MSVLKKRIIVAVTFSALLLLGSMAVEFGLVAIGVSFYIIAGLLFCIAPVFTEDCYL